MHVLMVIGAGLVVLAAFYFGARLFGKTAAAGALAFVVALINGVFGVVRAGIPILNEAGAFIPIFGLPAAIAWYLAYKFR
jgi:hypothetical protein